MTKRGPRTFVLLHPYGTSDGFKQVYAGNDSARIKRVVDGYLRAGWKGYIHTTRAGNFSDAVQKVGNRLCRPKQ